MLRAGGVLSLAAGAAAHAVMYEPPNRNTRGLEILGPGCGGGSCLWFNQGCDPDCANCTGGGAVYPPQRSCPGTPPAATLNDEKYRTWNVKKVGGSGDWTRFRPWRKPGSAPVTDPCGLAGGWYTPGSKGNGGDAPPGAKQGQAGSKLPKLLRKTEWVAGSTAEVAWAVYANHGGGYQYRLCPAGEALTEECFQKVPLEPIGDTNWIQYGKDGMDVNDRQEIPAIRVTEGVAPSGSTWTRNPIPPCKDVTGGAFNSPCLGYQFTPLTSNKPDVKLAGFGGGACGSSILGTKCSLAKMKKQSFQWGIVDKVKVPDVPPGEYVISFRWDSEQTPQVWSQCGDITIKTSGKPSTAFTLQKGCDGCCESVQGLCAHCKNCVNDKTGACADCWTPLVGYNPDMVPPVQCLGGDSTPWHPGDDRSAGSMWSPECERCWADPDACNPDTPTGPHPAPPAPTAGKYLCRGGVCAVDAAGVPLATCQAACSF